MSKTEQQAHQARMDGVCPLCKGAVRVGQRVVPYVRPDSSIGAFKGGLEPAGTWVHLKCATG